MVNKAKFFILCLPSRKCSRYMRTQIPTWPEKKKSAVSPYGTKILNTPGYVQLYPSGYSWIQMAWRANLELKRSTAAITTLKFFPFKTH